MNVKGSACRDVERGAFGRIEGTLVIREARAADIPALAELHVKTWNATYPNVEKKPTIALRERQWRDRFYEVLEGERLLDAAGDFHGAYGWRDLRRLASICPID